MARTLLCEKQIVGLPGMPSVHTLRAARRPSRAGTLDVPAHIRIGQGRGLIRYRVEDILHWLAAHGIALQEDWP